MANAWCGKLIDWRFPRELNKKGVTDVQNTDASNPDAVTAFSDCGSDDEPNWTAERARNNRMEALRAASRIVAGGHRSDSEFRLGAGASVESWTLCIAEQFAKWLETGKR